MSENPIIKLIEKQQWMQPGLEMGGGLIKNAFAAGGPAGQAAKDALHGVWLGHPLHPAVTDVPVGSWTVAAALDLFELRGELQYQAGADFAILLGLCGSIPAALSGIADWSETYGKPQRVGALHGLLNVVAAALYAGSYAARKSDRRGLGRTLGFLGYGLVFFSAFLGGELSYGQKIGVNHAPDPEGELPSDYKPVISESELVEGQPTKRSIGGTDILILKTGHRVYAIADKCSHAGGPLSEGEITGDSIVCPWHGSRFCLKDGRVQNGPATHSQPVLDVKVEGGQVLVRAREV